MDIGSIFFGLILVGIGVLTLKYNQQFANSVGTPAFVNKWLGPGREYSFYKLLSIVLMFVGCLFIFGLWGGVMNFVFSPLRGLVTRS